MPRTAAAACVALLCVGSEPAAASAAASGDLAAVTRHYDAAAVASGSIQVSGTADVVYVSGTSQAGPWLDVWRRSGAEWRKVAEVALAELQPVRFGARRHRSCGTS